MCSTLFKPLQYTSSICCQTVHYPVMYCKCASFLQYKSSIIAALWQHILPCQYMLQFRKGKLHWILNFIWVIDISAWLTSLQFLTVTMPVMNIKPSLFYRVVKNLGWPRPLKLYIYLNFEFNLKVNNCVSKCSWSFENFKRQIAENIC